MTNQLKVLRTGDRDIISRMFGRSIEEIIEALELIDASRRRNIWFRTANGIDYKVNDECIGDKMTRKEAVEKLIKNIDSPLASQQGFVNALEALGLLKFEEENVDMHQAIKKARADTSYGDTANFLKLLGEAGYKVDKA